MTSTAIVLAGLAWAGPARADDATVTKTEPYRVCGPRGCLAHSTDGTILWGPNGWIRGVVHDRGRGDTSVKITIVENGSIRRLPPIDLLEGDRPYTAGALNNATRIDISVCNGPSAMRFPCVTKSFSPN